MDRETKRKIAKQLAESPEMNNFYRALAIRHKNAVLQVFHGGGEGAEFIIGRAKKAAELLLKTENIDETTKQLTESPELDSFYRALAIKHTNAMFRVMGSIEKAKKETRHLLETEIIIEEENGNTDHKCPKGEIWDIAQGSCVPIEVILD